MSGFRFRSGTSKTFCTNVASTLATKACGYGWTGSGRCSPARSVCADLGLTLKDRDDHTAYIASWLQVLRDDKRAIFQAAAHAQRACDFLHGLQPKEEAA